MPINTDLAYVLDNGKYVDTYYIDKCPRYEDMYACWVVTNRPSGNFWTQKRFSTKLEWVAALTSKGAVLQANYLQAAYDGTPVNSLPDWMQKPQWSIIVTHSSGDKTISGFESLLSATDFGLRHLTALEWKTVSK